MSRVEQKKEKDNNVNKYGCIGCLGIVAVFFILSGVVSVLGSSNSSKSSDKIKTEQTTKNTSMSIEKNESRDNLASVAETILTNNFKDIASVSYDKENETFVLIPTDPDFKYSILAMQSGLANKDAWIDMTQSIVKLSESIKDTIGEKFGISVANPENTENTLLLIQDGTVIYNFSDEL